MLKCVKRPRMSFHLRPLTTFNLSPAAHNSRKGPVCAEASAGTTFPDAHSCSLLAALLSCPSPVLPCWSSSCVLVSAGEKWWKKDNNGPPLTVYTQTLATASSVHPLLSNEQHKQGCNLCPLPVGERRLRRAAWITEPTRVGGRAAPRASE